MTLNELKQYIEIDRKRLAPREADCSNLEAYKKIKDDIKTIADTDRKARDFSLSYAKKMFACNEISLTFYILACLPFLIWFLPINDGVALFYQNLEYNVTLGRFGWLFYILSCILLIINLRWRGITGRDNSGIGTSLRFAVLIICGYFGGYECITLFGSEYSWFFIALFSGCIVTFITRFMKSRNIAPLSRKYDDVVMQMNATAELITKSSRVFAGLGDLRQKELKERFPSVEPVRRQAWFDFKRRYDEKNVLQFPSCRNVETEFLVPFKESSETTHNTDSERNINNTTDIVIYSQEFGYKDITIAEAKSLLSASRIYPFFSLGLPEFIDGLEYKVFRHKWHYAKTKSMNGVLHKTREVDSQAQKDFDFYKGIDEYTLCEKYGMSMEDLRREMPQIVADYEAEMAKVRERIGSATEHYDQRVDHSYTSESRGDEIGVLTIRTSSGELLGLYCGDSIQSIRFAERIAKEETDFAYSPLIACFGDTQKAYLYNLYAKQA